MIAQGGAEILAFGTAAKLKDGSQPITSARRYRASGGARDRTAYPGH